MGFLIRLAVFLSALLLDASGIFRVPYVGGQPFLFVALSVCYGLRGTALRAGGWGFTGGTALGLVFSPERTGVLALSGLLAGATPSAVRAFLYWERWSGQAVLGGMGAALFCITRLLLLMLLGDLERSVASLLPGLAVDIALTAAVCPLAYRATRHPMMAR